MTSAPARHDATTEQRPPAPPERASRNELSRTAWTAMCDLVLGNDRRREAADAVGLSFGRVRALRRLAGGPMPMGELAAALTTDAPYATVMVDDLEKLGLVQRRPHPTDRRAKVVELTRRGKELAKRADAVLGTPPPALLGLDPDDLDTLVAILTRIAAASGAPVGSRARPAARARKQGASGA